MYFGGKGSARKDREGSAQPGRTGQTADNAASQERQKRELIAEGVRRVVKEHREVLRKLGNE